MRNHVGLWGGVCLFSVCALCVLCQQTPLLSFSLVSDMNYVAQNAGRILRALFEISLRQNQATLSTKLLRLCKCVDRRLWWGLHTPLRQVR
jgi:activating signal cointegrator complex subunit 3